MTRTRLVAFAAAVCLLGVALGAASQEITGTFGPTDPTDPLLVQGPKPVATGGEAMVSTQLASSTLAAVEVLREGGNAVDAALTALFLQQIHDYHMVFLFGSMSALVYEAATGEIHALNAVGERADPDRQAGECGSGCGDASQVVIGGTVRGAGELAERFGTRSWERLIAPAVAAAEEGAIVTSYMYGLNFQLFDSGYLAGGLDKNPAARAFYMPDGHLVPVGERWRMPALAETLRRLAAEGPDYIYDGEWGEKFVEAARKAGGRVTLEEMAAYRARWEEPTRFTYRGHPIVGSPPPDTGGLVVGFNLNVLERFDLAAKGPYTESAETLALLARTFARVGRETGGAIRDPETYRNPVALWLSPDYGRLVADYVRQTEPRVDLSPASGATVAAGSPSGAPAGGFVSLGSDQIVIADGQGNWISLLHTMHGGAPGVFVNGVRASGTFPGVPGPERGPGRRLALPITSIFVLGDDGAPWLAMGTPGNPPQPVTEMLVQMLDFGVDPAVAAEAPRFWAERDGHRVRVRTESRLGDGVVEGLRARGIEVELLGDFTYHTGSMQIVWHDPETGELRGASDPRRLGYAAGF